jgi:hypothetical protein
VWDPFQREVLAALGHELLVPAGAQPDATRAGPAAATAAMPPLLRALTRAAGGDPARLPPLPPLDQLRSPAAKRALWPRLRALRRGSPS